MKKIFSFIICVALALCITGCGQDKPVLKVYNAGEYIDTTLISDFEDE